MRTGFDAHMVGQQETGNETYALGLLSGLEHIGFPVDVYTFTPWPFRIHRTHTLHPRQSIVRIPVTTPLLALRDRLDLFHSTYVLPPWLPCPGVVTVHDITFALFPEWFPVKVRTMLNTLVPLSLARATQVITISEHTRQDILARYGLPAEKVSVTHLAPRPGFSTPRPMSEPPKPYFLFVGNVEPRKNVELVVRSLALLAARRIKVPLIIAGKPGWRHQSVSEFAGKLGVSDLIRMPGYVDDEELRKLYEGCTAVVHPSLYEGFGLTVLEAMAMGAPVLASDRASIPEVAGDAAVLLDPMEPDDWALAMERAVTDHAWRDALRVQGEVRARQFSWDRCARETVTVYHRALRPDESIF